MSHRDPGRPAAPGWRAILPAALLLALVALPFLPALRGGLVYDDLLLIGRNPFLGSLEHLPRAFTSGYWDFLGPEAAARIGYWRPLTTLVLILITVIGGGSPLSFHLFSLAGHLAATAVALRLFRRLTGSLPLAFGGALLFGVHPLHVESVAWISALNDPLCGLFALLALDSYLRWRQGGSAGSPWRAALLLLLGMLAKETAAAALPMMLAMDLGRGLAGRERRWWLAGPRPFLRAWLPFGGALLLWYLARAAVFRSPAAGLDRGPESAVAGFAHLLARVELLGESLELLAWPVSLRLFRPFLPTVGALLASFAACLIFLGGLALAVRRRAWLAATSLLLMPAGVAPLLAAGGSLGSFPLSDRHLYLPVLGFALLLGRAAFSRLPARAAALALAGIALLYGARSLERCRVWLSEEAFFRAAVAENPDLPSAHWGLGRVRLLDYQARQEPAALHEARALFLRCLDLVRRAGEGEENLLATAEDSLEGRLGLAWCRFLEGQGVGREALAEAAQAFAEIARDHPESELAWTGLGVALAEQGELDRAEEALGRAIAQNRYYAEAWYNLARLQLLRKRPEAATANLGRSLELRPGSLWDLLLLARALAGAGRREEAARVAVVAAKAHPDRAAPAVLAGSLLAAGGDLEAAAAWAVRALRANPAHGPAHALHGKLLLKLGDREGALEAFRQAARLSPLDFESHYNAGSLLLERGRSEDGRPFLEKALELLPRAPAPTREKVGELLRRALAGLPPPASRPAGD